MAAVSDNTHMADVPLYVALITAGAGIVGAAIPQAGIMLNEFRRADRDRQEKSAAAAQNACIELLRAASTLCVHVENMRSYRGDADGLHSRLAEVRKDLADTQLHAASVGMLAPGPLTGPAAQLAESAASLVEAVEANIDINNAVMVGDPDTRSLNALISAFRENAIRHTRANEATGPVPSHRLGLRRLLGNRAEARDRSRPPPA